MVAVAHFTTPNVSKEIQEQIERENHIIQKAMWEVDPGFLDDVRTESALDGDMTPHENNGEGNGESSAYLLDESSKASARHRRRRWRSKLNKNVGSANMDRRQQQQQQRKLPTLDDEDDNSQVTYPGSSNQAFQNDDAGIYTRTKWNEREYRV